MLTATTQPPRTPTPLMPIDAMWRRVGLAKADSDTAFFYDLLHFGEMLGKLAVSGIGFLSRGDRELGVLRNVEPPTRPRLECLRETVLILRCDRKVGNPFQTKQGSRPSCPDQEGRKGSEEGVPENLSVPDRKSTRLNSSHQKISYAVF